jgi:hypothetical protein
MLRASSPASGVGAASNRSDMIATHMLEISQTWDGVPLAPEERACLRLALRDRRLSIAVDAPLHGDPAPKAPVGATPELWEHEVVELFVAATEPPWHYTEVELSPWGHHLVLRLEGIRRPVAVALPLHFRARRTARRWTGVARLPRALLPPGPWRVNAFAIHGPAGHRRYLAAHALPGPQPNFHQPDRFPIFDWSPRPAG